MLVAPRVFVSSTTADLETHRTAVQQAITAHGFHPFMMEHWGPDGKRPALESCIARVRECDLMVAIIGDLYGWTPEHVSNPHRKSITWLECEEAYQLGKDVFAFVLDGEAGHDRRFTEGYALQMAVRSGRPLNAFRNIKRWARFLEWLEKRVTFRHFSTPDDLKYQVGRVLSAWQKLPAHAAAAPVDTSRYWQSLRSQLESMPLPSLFPGTAGRRPLHGLYVGLRGVVHVDGVRRELSLEAVLEERTAAIVGCAGAGKTTFLHHVALTLLDPGASAASPELARLCDEGTLPFFLRAADLANFLSARHDNPPATADSPGWLIRHLASMSRERRWSLPPEYIEKVLSDGPGLLLIDGLDEIVEPMLRERTAQVIANAARVWESCRFVIASRPETLSADMAPGFRRVRIARLGRDEIGQFIEKWTEQLFDKGSRAAGAYRKSIAHALSTPEIRHLARTPLLLAVIANVHSREQRLPERRAALYALLLESLIQSGASAAPPHQVTRALPALRALAFAMHDRSSARPARMHLEDAARSILPKFDGQVDAAREFLEYQAGHGALLVKRGSDISFSHFSFQEYLAAAAIAGRTDADQSAVLFERPERLYDPAWLDTIRFLAGILSDHADVRLDQAVSTVLAHPGIREPVEAVSCAALLAAMEEELITEIPIALPDTLTSLAELVQTALVEQPFDTWPEPVRLRAGMFAGRHARRRPACWRQVKGGWFLMGGQSASEDGRGYDPEARPVESPPHRVSVESFEMLANPVTVEMWGEFMRQGGYRDEKWWTAGGFHRWSEPSNWPKQTRHPTLPVTGVSWFEAMACCRWLGGRLPTEAEWEFAAAGRKHRRFPWGDEAPQPSRARFGHRTGGIAPVGLYPNGRTPEENIFDMAGNAWEWVFDRFGPYSGDESRDPAGPDEGEERVLRGGSWINPASFLRNSTRVHCPPEMRYCTFGPIGFRCVRQ